MGDSATEDVRVLAHELYGAEARRRRNRKLVMPRGPHHYKSKGACIYCGVRDELLTGEHLFPTFWAAS